MTISELKKLEEILGYLEGEQRVFLVGCSDCATVCQVGGEDQLKEMKVALEAAGKEVTGYVIGEPGCHLLGLKRQLREHKEAVGAADSLLILSCGTGTQTAVMAVDKPVHPATNTLFLGQVQRFGQFAELCSACGNCILEETKGICPITRCAKSLLNGPCGGTSAEGKCEADPENDCAWKLIYDRMREAGAVNQLSGYKSPKDHRVRPGRRVSEKGGVAA
jgi:hypothetical protein